jgi:RNA recognition motif-containing protein
MQPTIDSESSGDERNESSDTGRMMQQTNESFTNASETNSSVGYKGTKRKFPPKKRQEERSSKSLETKSKSRNRSSSSSISNRVTIPGNKLFVGDIPLHFTEEDIFRVFSDFGEVKDVTLLKKNNGRGLSKVARNLSKFNIASSLS